MKYQTVCSDGKPKTTVYNEELTTSYMTVFSRAHISNLLSKRSSLTASELSWIRKIVKHTEEQIPKLGCYLLYGIFDVCRAKKQNRNIWKTIYLRTERARPLEQAQSTFSTIMIWLIQSGVRLHSQGSQFFSHLLSKCHRHVPPGPDTHASNAQLPRYTVNREQSARKSLAVTVSGNVATHLRQLRTVSSSILARGRGRQDASRPVISHCYGQSVHTTWPLFTQQILVLHFPRRFL